MIVRIGVDDDGFTSPSVEFTECDECCALTVDWAGHSAWHDSLRGDSE